MSEDLEHNRPIRSYVIRAGRLTGAQRKALDTHWQDYVIEHKPEPIQLDALFPTQSNLIVEIGFGMGDSLLEMATEQSDSNFIGIEVHRPGIGKLLHGIVRHKLTNLKIIHHDAKEVMLHCFGPASISKILIFFPDPWPKKRHQKRRLLQPDFISLLAEKLSPGGEIHLATDWQDYAEHMMKVMEASEELSNRMGSGAYWPQPQRPGTNFERRGKRLGHGVWDLLFGKGESAA